MSNFFRWLADVGPTLGRRSKSRWADVGSHRQADGCADVGPTSACYLGSGNPVTSTESHSLRLNLNYYVQRSSILIKAIHETTFKTSFGVGVVPRGAVS